jgi:hypothetical protein
MENPEAASDTIVGWVRSILEKNGKEEKNPVTSSKIL